MANQFTRRERQAFILAALSDVGKRGISAFDPEAGAFISPGVTGSRKSAMHSNARPLVAKGWISKRRTREKVVETREVVRYYLTEKGREALAALSHLLPGLE